MKKQMIRILTVILVIVAVSTSVLVYASSNSIFTDSLTLKNISTNGPEYFENGPTYIVIGDIIYSGGIIGQVSVMIGPPYVNSSEIPILFEVTQMANFGLDSVTVDFLRQFIGI